MSRGEGVARRSGGFTLLEVLLSLAIIALLAGVLIGGAGHLSLGQPSSATDVFWQAVREARKTALNSGHEIRLRFDADRRRFYLVDGEAPPPPAVGVVPAEVRLKEFAVPSEVARDLTVEFLGPATKGASVILVGGVMMESRTLGHVTFYSDGTCQPFRAQLARGGPALVLAIDPWTCAPVLPPPDANAPPPF
jgi:prepilin-type N-terminal cleavage/methylation domain-containing protein